MRIKADDIGKLNVRGKKKSFLEYMSAEDHMQHQVITWLQYQHPKLKYHHSPDAGQRTKFEQFKYKYLGSDAGFLDLTFPSLLLAIELKVKPNKPTPAQLDWIQYLLDNNWTAVVCYSFEEATEEIQTAITIAKAAGLSPDEETILNNIKKIME
jgi:hypothetical protein